MSSVFHTGDQEGEGEYSWEAEQDWHASGINRLGYKEDAVCDCKAGADNDGSVCEGLACEERGGKIANEENTALHAKDHRIDHDHEMKIVPLIPPLGIMLVKYPNTVGGNTCAHR